MAKHIDIFKALDTDTTDEGVTIVSVPGMFDLPVSCEYWFVGGDGDQWRYRLSGADAPRFAFSHPSEKGCKIAIVRHFVEVGLISVPLDNSHLDDENQSIAEAILVKWNERKDRPRVGDFLRLADGATKRICSDVDDGFQTTFGGSFSIGNSGGASYSGGLDAALLIDRFKLTSKTSKGRFWFFSHNRAGAGCGVDVFLPCRVYELVDVTMTLEEAIAHPSAVSSRDFWGEGHSSYLNKVSALMRGELR